ncbi:MAG TPA: hypothetical protein VK943_10135, partial [Arenibaculum sp.]|nr:hypothetical protein [Arenibaculum sp.]
WVTYPRGLEAQSRVAADWRAAVDRMAGGAFKPFSQALHVDLSADPDEPPAPIHLGLSLGRRPLTSLLYRLRNAGIHHVVLNLKQGRRPAAEVIEEMAEHVLPRFPALATAKTAPDLVSA